MSRFNRFFVRWLSSPLGSLSGRAMLVRYEGRVSGRRYRLPVNPMPYEGGFVIRVGYPERKTWWRNFTEPRPIELVRGVRTTRGTGVVVPGSSERGQRIATDYFAARHGAARRAGLPRTWKGEIASAEQLESAAAGMVFIVVTPDR